MIFLCIFHAMAAGGCLRAEFEFEFEFVCKDRLCVPYVCTYVGRFFYEFILLIQEMSPHIKILQKFRVEPILVASEWAALGAILSSLSAKSEKPLRNHAEKK